MIQDPSPILSILESLKNDPSEYVRRSVANNLNDISKDHPELVLKLAKNWIGQNAETDKLIRHGLRTLLKKPHPQALELFDYGSASKVKCTNWNISPDSAAIGDKAQLSFGLDISNFKGKIWVEYLIDFVKANGSTSTKVFQWIDKTVGAEKALSATKKLGFKNLTTRVHYQGVHDQGAHSVHLRINGARIASTKIMLTKKRSTHV